VSKAKPLHCCGDARPVADAAAKSPDGCSERDINLSQHHGPPSMLAAHATKYGAASRWFRLAAILREGASRPLPSRGRPARGRPLRPASERLQWDIVESHCPPEAGEGRRGADSRHRRKSQDGRGECETNLARHFALLFSAHASGVGLLSSERRDCRSCRPVRSTARIGDRTSRVRERKASVRCRPFSFEQTGQRKGETFRLPHLGSALAHL
jgi:hypothetical protein